MENNAHVNATKEVDEESLWVVVVQAQGPTNLFEVKFQSATKAKRKRVMVGISEASSLFRVSKEVKKIRNQDEPV